LGKEKKRLSKRDTRKTGGQKRKKSQSKPLKVRFGSLERNTKGRECRTRGRAWGHAERGKKNSDTVSFLGTLHGEGRRFGPKTDCKQGRKMVINIGKGTSRAKRGARNILAKVDIDIRFKGEERGNVFRKTKLPLQARSN